MSRTKLAFLVVVVALMLGVAVVSISAVYAGGFGFLSEAIDVAGKLVSSGASV